MEEREIGNGKRMRIGEDKTRRLERRQGMEKKMKWKYGKQETERNDSQKRTED